jgi:hypothetical protein
MLGIVAANTTDCKKFTFINKINGAAENRKRVS